MKDKSVKYYCKETNPEYYANAEEKPGQFFRIINTLNRDNYCSNNRNKPGWIYHFHFKFFIYPEGKSLTRNIKCRILPKSQNKKAK